jgi:hypothetical protein
VDRTVSDSRLSLIELPDDPNVFQLTRVVDRRAASLDLDGSSARLLVRQVVVVVDGRCQTESYTYRLQSGEAMDSWLIRWEYQRQPPRPDYVYPAAHVHVHVHGAFPDAEPIGRLHIPTRRVPFELILWHLIAESGVESKSRDWQTLLTESIEGFDERRTAP